MDFGCAEGAFLERCCRSFYGRVGKGFSLLGVDIDEDTLKAAEARLRPDQNLYDDQIMPPIVTYLLQGSIAKYDDRLEHVDAVVAIEL